MKINWDRVAFRRMTNLKILFLKEAWFLNGPLNLPDCLTVLQWWGYLASCLPTNFDPSNLAVLDLRGGCLRSLEPKIKWENMTTLNLRKCQFISQIPDGSGFPNLVELNLEGCYNLIEIPDSMGFLEKLEIFNVRYCTKLRAFPRAIKMPNLLHLGLEGCRNLEKFPEILEKMQYIENLDLSDRDLELPFSICNITGLRNLNMRGCGRVILLPSNLAMLQRLEGTCNEDRREGQEEASFLLCPNVEVIRLPGCDISDAFLPICLTWFSNVKCLNLSVNGFSIIPACIKDCCFLEKRYVDPSKHPREINGIPPKLEELWARDCLWRRTSLSQELQEGSDTLFFVPGSAIFEWIHHSSRGQSISFWFRGRAPMICLCFVRKQMVLDVLSAEVNVNGRITLFNEGDMMKDTMIIYCSMSSHYMLMSWDIKITDEIGPLLLSGWNHVEICIYEDVWRHLKEMGIHVKEEDGRMEDIRFTNPYKRTKVEVSQWQLD
ncbi:disease resistance protein TAO1-like [Neltuma alba]|uniref:disease resistance protein TAO1-like n=1 Tax=Neltuma alba TaxID=207710 RepID=UPI0010A43064|nr:disease resistance protein TAO1-like [Prosopis alba]